ncbi:hypothetical protein ABZ799_28175 [Nocardiopsis dassonvillei]|uniref:hypothetical protein n=1 Tax=Nocardiopsis dassonvillei TaxID=2014 RepID=UPI0033FEAC1B
MATSKSTVNKFNHHLFRYRVFGVEDLGGAQGPTGVEDSGGVGPGHLLVLQHPVGHCGLREQGSQGQRWDEHHQQGPGDEGVSGDRRDRRGGIAACSRSLPKVAEGRCVAAQVGGEARIGNPDYSVLASEVGVGVQVHHDRLVDGHLRQRIVGFHMSYLFRATHEDVRIRS